jgi:phosphoglycolate phosphatase
LLTRHYKTGTIVFDLDGTLIDSAPNILEAFADALCEAGITPQVFLDSSLIGPPLTETLMRISGSTDAALIRSLTAKFKQHYDSTGVVKTKAYPGIEAMLDDFMAAGASLHICTNKRLSATHAILENLGWKDRFMSVYALDMVEPRMPGKAQLLSKQIGEQSINTATTIYVGDKLEDGHAAEANALTFYYASWGYGDLQQGQMDVNWNWLNCPGDLSKS